MKENTSLQMTQSPPKIKKNSGNCSVAAWHLKLSIFHSAYSSAAMFSFFAELWHHFVAASTPKTLQRPREHGPDPGLSWVSPWEADYGIGHKAAFPYSEGRGGTISFAGFSPWWKWLPGFPLRARWFQGGCLDVNRAERGEENYLIPLLAILRYQAVA